MRDAPAPPALPTPPHRRVSNASIAIAAASTVVEWYDFTLYLYFATVVARLFYGGDSAASLGTTLAGFALAYLMRPLGAAVFGHVGDRHGRKVMLLWSMALMSAAMLATALLPTMASIGPAAGVLLLLLRCVMGFAVGGEYSGVVAYLLEGAAPRRRGLVASSASAASEVGGLLAVGVSAATVALLSEAQLAGWGWRIPFFVGAALAGSVFVARSAMEESPDFEAQRAEGRVPEQPWRHSWTHHRGGIARAFAISALGSITYYVGITYVPAYLTSVGKMSEARSLILSTIAAVVVIAVTPLTGMLSDRVGRRPVLVGVAVLSMVLPISLFLAMANGTWGGALAGAVALAAVAGAMSAVGAVATAEQFPGEGRVTGLAFGATGATAIFGGLTPWLAHWLTERTGNPAIPGVMIAAVALAVLPLFWRLRETAPARD
ncbi:MFS transporter [Sphingomonas sp. ASV193]|uniref:MFS transporter n=1 Tax=Sphingomonas sp. ASV193 TaxID=3144405 RepID=UPI0032E86475